MLSASNCGGRGSSECATPLTYVTNQFTSGDQALRHASEYRLGLSVGSDDFVVTALLDTASSALVINEKNFVFGTKTSTARKPFILGSGNTSGLAINAKDDVDIGCMLDKSTRFALTSKDASVDNTMGVSFGDPAHHPHEGHSTPFFDQLVREEGLKNIFSLALCRNFGPSHILLGGVDEAMKPFIGNYIELIEKTAYVVPALSLRWGDTKQHIADFPHYNAATKTGVRTILDSSSSFLLLPVAMAESVAKNVEKTAGALDILHHFPEGFFRTERANSVKTVRFLNLTQIRQFPPLEVSFRGVDGSIKNLEIPSEHYLKVIDSEQPLLRTFAVRETNGDVLLGQPFLESHYTVFDRGNSRIGFGNIDVACAQGRE